MPCETLMAFQEIRIGQPDGFNVTRGLWEGLEREDLEQKQTRWANSSTMTQWAALTATQLDEKHAPT